MKILIPLLGVAAIAAAYVAFSAPEPGYAAPRAEGIATLDIPRAVLASPGEGEALREFQVEGMCCGGCAEKLHGALLALPGVREAGVDVASGRVQVLADAEVSAELLAATLAPSAKYTVTARP